MLLPASLGLEMVQRLADGLRQTYVSVDVSHVVLMVTIAYLELLLASFSVPANPLPCAAALLLLLLAWPAIAAAQPSAMQRCFKLRKLRAAHLLVQLVSLRVAQGQTSKKGGKLLAGSSNEASEQLWR